MLDFERIKAASPDDLVALLLCEVSRFVDAHERLAAAVERMAPTIEDLQPAPPVDGQVPTCPHPVELRVNLGTMGMDAFAIYKCGVCQETVDTRVAVEA